MAITKGPKLWKTSKSISAKGLEEVKIYATSHCHKQVIKTSRSVEIFKTFSEKYLPAEFLQKQFGVNSAKYGK